MLYPWFLVLSHPGSGSKMSDLFKLTKMKILLSCRVLDGHLWPGASVLDSVDGNSSSLQKVLEGGARL